MSKFNEILEKQIKRKAELTENNFFTEFEKLLCRYGLSHSVMTDGLKYYQKTGGKEDQWRDVVREIFIGLETEKFLSELYKFENYFKDGRY